jgi:hypothetical protein
MTTAMPEGVAYERPSSSSLIPVVVAPEQQPIAEFAALPAISDMHRSYSFVQASPDQQEQASALVKTGFVDYWRGVKETLTLSNGAEHMQAACGQIAAHLTAAGLTDVSFSGIKFMRQQGYNSWTLAYGRSDAGSGLELLDSTDKVQEFAPDNKGFGTGIVDGPSLTLKTSHPAASQPMIEITVGAGGFLKSRCVRDPNSPEEAPAARIYEFAPTVPRQQPPEEQPGPLAEADSGLAILDEEAPEIVEAVTPPLEIIPAIDARPSRIQRMGNWAATVLRGEGRATQRRPRALGLTAIRGTMRASRPAMIVPHPEAGFLNTAVSAPTQRLLERLTPNTRQNSEHKWLQRFEGDYEAARVFVSSVGQLLKRAWVATEGDRAWLLSLVTPRLRRR